MADDHTSVDHIEAGDKPGELVVTWEGGASSRIDLSGLIARDPEFAALARPEIFARVSAADWGWGAEWPDGINCSARVLSRLARDQHPWATEDYIGWQDDLGLSNQQAADVLGVTTRTIEYYRSGKPLSRTVQIACMAIRDDPAYLDAFYKVRKPGRPPRRDS
ncbi:MAG: DUF2442 domain-containing protein [Alphaproteobacteria bacterium]|nr:DUF2442 domain-containing protein [Alphaproteobacteria bacterium]